MYKQLDGASQVVEIGIGGGQATLPFLKKGCQVTAVEYRENLAKVCRLKYSRYPNFKVITSKFEEVPLRSNAFNLIYSATAFHWIPEEAGYNKVFDMLKPGGVFARFANHPFKGKSREELHLAIQEIYAVYMPGKSLGKEFTTDNAKVLSEVALNMGLLILSIRHTKEPELLHQGSTYNYLVPTRIIWQ